MQSRTSDTGNTADVERRWNGLKKINADYCRTISFTCYGVLYCCCFL